MGVGRKATSSGVLEGSNTTSRRYIYSLHPVDKLEARRGRIERVPSTHLEWKETGNSVKLNVSWIQAPDLLEKQKAGPT